MMLGAGTLRYWVHSPGGAVHEVQPYAVSAMLVSPTILHPGEVIAGGHRLLWEWTGYTFPEVGQYRLVATFTSGLAELSSNVLAIDVEEPSGPDVDAFPLVFRQDVGHFLTAESYQLQEAIGSLTRLLEVYPRSSYAPYAAYALALRASKPGWFCPEPGSGILNRIPADYGKAVSGFERVLRDWPQSVAADDAQYELARTYRDMGDTAAASEALTEFLERFAPTSDRLADAVKLADELGWETASARSGSRQVDWTGLREVADNDRANVTWLPESGVARVTRGRLSVEVREGRRVAALGNGQIPLTVSPQTKDGRLLVPASFAKLLPRLLREGRAFDPIPVGEPAVISG
ncbi:MAG: tetratricopeptide repeat protein [Armatimonadota bacterium]